MRKFWKIENNVNVRNAETRKSRKAVNAKIVRKIDISWMRTKVLVSFEDLKDTILNMKDLYGITRTREFLETYGYSKINDIKPVDYEKILRATRIKIYEYTT